MYSLYSCVIKEIPDKLNKWLLWWLSELDDFKWNQFHVVHDYYPGLLNVSHQTISGHNHHAMVLLELPHNAGTHCPLRMLDGWPRNTDVDCRCCLPTRQLEHIGKYPKPPKNICYSLCCDLVTGYTRARGTAAGDLGWVWCSWESASSACLRNIKLKRALNQQ